MDNWRNMIRDQFEQSSAGHKLGQFIGDWFEGYFVLPLMNEVAKKLSLFADNRFVARTARGEKILWKDDNGNSVDYDFVLELEGSESKLGIPVAFIECFWRRGARHSKDKARDDSGKLMPMRSAYPTARFLGIVGAGDFTEPSRELIRSRDIDLFYVTKDKIIQAFLSNGLIVDYPDTSPEIEKARIANAFERAFTEDKKRDVAATLIELIGKAAVNSYVDRVNARLSALPQEIRLILRHESNPIVFKSIIEVEEFLIEPKYSMDDPQESFLVQITYSDGTEYEQCVDSVEGVRDMLLQVKKVTEHFENI
jgi:hypothetical protein